MTLDSDPFRYCIHCGADCAVEDPEHDEACPFVTGVWTITPAELEPCAHCGHPTRPVCCMDCGAELGAGDCYALRDVDGFCEVVCLGCAAIVELLPPLGG